MKKQPQKTRGNNNFVLALGASQMGFMVGLWLDKKMNTTPLFGFIGLIAGFASGIRILVLLVKGRKNNGA